MLLEKGFKGLFLTGAQSLGIRKGTKKGDPDLGIYGDQLQGLGIEFFED
jgi:hypothetical protein